MTMTNLIAEFAEMLMILKMGYLFFIWYKIRSVPGINFFLSIVK